MDKLLEEFPFNVELGVVPEEFPSDELGLVTEEFPSDVELGFVPEEFPFIVEFGEEFSIDVELGLVIEEFPSDVALRVVPEEFPFKVEFGVIPEAFPIDVELEVVENGSRLLSLQTVYNDKIINKILLSMGSHITDMLP